MEQSRVHCTNSTGSTVQYAMPPGGMNGVLLWACYKLLSCVGVTYRSTYTAQPFQVLVSCHAVQPAATEAVACPQRQGNAAEQSHVCKQVAEQSAFEGGVVPCLPVSPVQNRSCCERCYALVSQLACYRGEGSQAHLLVSNWKYETLTTCSGRTSCNACT